MAEMTALQPATIGTMVLKNRIIRSATYEGRCDQRGCPGPSYRGMYAELARNDVGAMITGFAYVTASGRAMQPRQAGMENESKIRFFEDVTTQVHRFGSRIFLQLAHAGRQTSRRATGEDVVGASGRMSPYFREKPRPIGTREALGIVDRFADAALFARRAGFDGVQIHAAHGYLVHQFLSPAVNDRKDMFRIDERSGIGARFLELIIDSIRERCGSDYPVLVKISGADDDRNGISEARLAALVDFLSAKRVAAIEISYGTMDHPLNIFRGRSVPIEAILRYNPRYGMPNGLARSLWKALAAPFVLSRIKPITPTYNLAFAEAAKRRTRIPIISVGGFRTGNEIEGALAGGKADFIGLCRPLLCEPDFVQKLKRDSAYVSRCISCNLCAVLCDTRYRTRCHLGEAIHDN
jgi:2,4-dienoyl-CoA reductase-like NADH-dependent reductase (Old Yellow Enzyme family)